MSKQDSQNENQPVRRTITHKDLKEAVSKILKDDKEMVMVLKTEEQKPMMYWDVNLNGEEYVNCEDKAGYIKAKTGLDRESVLLPIVKPVLDKVASNIGSKAVTNIEKELYDIVVNAN